MITQEQIQQLTRKFKTNQTVIFREYLQLLFLENLYSVVGSEKVYFKGGTAIHLLWNSFRFSEDLDFTVDFSKARFIKFISKVFSKVLINEGLSVKKRKSIAGIRYLLTYSNGVLPFKVFITLDFSFREKPKFTSYIKKGENHPAGGVDEPIQINHSPKASVQSETENHPANGVGIYTFIKTDFPIIFTNFLYHLTPKEILAEKIRAILTRKKGRDFFDLWLLLAKGVKLDWNLINQKMNYYPKLKWSKEKIHQTIQTYSLSDFEKDLKPFLPLNERARLKKIYAVSKKVLLEELK
ncbi:nucleotidyl transferase AbiEii/AbiGii toxin family protein [Candidatus Microgenomates bacterium]|nr:nucleotidyl transferase AbiEii/AbiGii toxin family protein [Candidatus Microgenomates bacterium]